MESLRGEIANMQLPEGKTCADCHHFLRFCKSFFGCKPTNTECDWSPSRFVQGVGESMKPQTKAV